VTRGSLNAHVKTHEQEQVGSKFLTNRKQFAIKKLHSDLARSGFKFFQKSVFISYFPSFFKTQLQQTIGWYQIVSS
jgi:hypothetical protein